jgi:predicted nuclease of predicted toxin-antitoxin system
MRPSTSATTDSARAGDVVIFERAAGEGPVIVSADTDFGTLLAVPQAAAPSVILFRRGAHSSSVIHDRGPDRA